MRVRGGVLLSLIAAACTVPARERLSQGDSLAVVAELKRVLSEAYDLSRPKPYERMLSLYPGSGPVVSASGGRVQASRDSLESGIRYFWDNVGVNMRDPRWVWDTSHVAVLSPNAAVITATYHIPHRNPRNEPHVLGGAMTMVFQKRGARWLIVHEHLSDLPQGPDTSATNPTHDDQ